MKNTRQPYLVILITIGLIVGIVWEFAPLQDASKRFQTLPLVGDKFRGEDIPLDEWEKSTFGHINLLKRLYTFNGQSYFVTMMDGTKDRHIVHDPQYCFTGSGWKIVAREQLDVANGTASLLKMRKGLLYREAVVWFSNGHSRHSSPVKYFLQTSLRRLSLGYSGPEPVMILLQTRYGQRSNSWNDVLSSPLWSKI